MNVTRLFLVRHGATTATEEDRFRARAAPNCRSRAGGRPRASANACPTGPHRRLFEPALPSPRHRTHHRERCGLEPITRDGLREIGHGHWEGLKRKDVEEHFAAERRVGSRPVFLRPGRWRVRRRSARASPAGDSRDRHRAPGRPRPRRFAQGDATAGVEQPARLRSARLSRSPRPVPRLPERRRLRSGAGPADALQRHLPLRRPPAHPGSEPVEVVESGESSG